VICFCTVTFSPPYRAEAEVIADEFEGLPPLKRHKLVYAVLDEYIKSGAIHALTIRAFTKSEWQEKQKTIS